MPPEGLLKATTASLGHSLQSMQIIFNDALWLYPQPTPLKIPMSSLESFHLVLPPGLCSTGYLSSTLNILLTQRPAPEQVGRGPHMKGRHFAPPLKRHGFKQVPQRQYQTVPTRSSEPLQRSPPNRNSQSSPKIFTYYVDAKRNSKNSTSFFQSSRGMGKSSTHCVSTPNWDPDPVESSIRSPLSSVICFAVLPRTQLSQKAVSHSKICLDGNGDSCQDAAGHASTSRCSSADCGEVSMDVNCASSSVCHYYAISGVRTKLRTDQARSSMGGMFTNSRVRTCQTYHHTHSDQTGSSRFESRL